MGKLSSHRGKNLTAPTVGSYVSDLADRLKHELPEVDANEIVAETEAHLNDRVDELTAEGATVAEAEKAALAGFGPAHTFSARVAASATETRATAWARRFGRLSVLATFFGAFALTGTFRYYWWMSQFRLGSPLPTTMFFSETDLDVIFPATLTAAAGIAICGFLTRKSQTRNILVASGAALILILLPLIYVGPGRPSNMLNFRDSMVTRIANRQIEISFLRRKIALAHNPSEYRRQSMQASLRAPEALPSDENLYPNEESYMRIWHASSVSDAIAAWKKNGPVWLAYEERRYQSDAGQLTQYPLWVDWHGFRSVDIWLWVIPFAAALVAIDRVASWAGRRVFLAHRRRRKRQAA